jgi:hypothetical protein
MISVFEYVTILISIILGLGITKLLGGFATMAVRINQCTLHRLLEIPRKVTTSFRGKLTTKS